MVEYRVIHAKGHPELGHPSFVLVDFHCTRPGCDCRRVVLRIFERDTRQLVATISHAFDPPDDDFHGLGQTFLDPVNPQSPISGAVLSLFKHLLVIDPEIGAMLERRYAVFREALDNPAHPSHAAMMRFLGSDPMRGKPRPDKPSRPPNTPPPGKGAPCHCGSGKRSSQCCRR
jgi:hypothetical protein